MLYNISCTRACMCVHAQSLQLCPTLCNPMDCTPQVPLSMGFSRQEYWSGLPCPPPGDLPDPGIEPASLYVSCFGRQVLYHERHLGSTSSSHMALKSIHTVGDSHSYTSNLDPPLSSRLRYLMASPHHLWISSTHLKASLPQAEPHIALPFPKRAPAQYPLSA